MSWELRAPRRAAHGAPAAHAPWPHCTARRPLMHSNRPGRPQKKKKKKLIRVVEPTVADDYELTGRELGEGSYSVVHECRNRANGKLYAAKLVDLEGMSDHHRHRVRDQVQKELELLEKCRDKVRGRGAAASSGRTAPSRPSRPVC